MEFELQPQPLKMDEPLTGENLKNLKNMQIGSGSTQFNAGKDGIFLGADNFADAPFSVDMAGQVKANLFTDKTYNFNGVFGKVYTSTATTGSTVITVAPDQGGLMDISVNVLDTGNYFYPVPPFDISAVYYTLQLTGGNYVVTLNNENIDTNYTPVQKLFVTVYFNSNEESGL